MLQLEASSGTLRRGSAVLQLRPKTAALLCYLIGRRGRLIGRDELREAVWGKTHGNENAHRQCIRELRHALGDSAKAPLFIETVGQRGYRFIGDIEVTNADRVDQPANLRDGPRAICVGRADEFKILESALIQARRGGRPVCFVSGEPGSGKTTVIDGFVSSMIRGNIPWIARGQCNPFSREPYGPLLEAVSHLAAEHARTDFGQLIREFAPSLLAQLPGIFGDREAAEKRAELIGSGPERLSRELSDILERLTQQQPGIIVLEDLHWADAATLGWIWSWAVRRAPARLMIVGTYRPEEACIEEGQLLISLLQQLHRLPAFRELALGGLNMDEVHHYLAERFPLHGFPSWFSTTLTQRTEGHPLFMTALIDEWFEHGRIHRSEGRWVVSGNAEDLTESIPADARLLIDHQAARLTIEQREILEAASAAGQPFSAAILVHDAIDVPTAERQCDELAERRLFIRRVGSARWPDGTVAATYTFAHILYREGVHRKVPPAIRAELHRRIGLRLESAYRGQTREISSSLAEHFEHAGDLQRAAHYRRQIGEIALGRRAADEAIRQFRHALEHLSRLPESRAQAEQELLVQLSLGLALMVGGEFTAPEVNSTYCRAGELADVLSDAVGTVRALRGQWEYSLTVGNLAGMKKIATRLEEIRFEPNNPTLEMDIHNILGQTKWIEGELLSVDEHVGKVLQMYALQRRAEASVRFGLDPGVGCHSYAAIVKQLRGLTDAAKIHFDQGLALAREIRQPFGMAHILWSGAVTARERGDIETVRRHAEEILILCETAQMDYWRALAHVLAGWASAISGNAAGLDQIRFAFERWPRSAVAYHLALLAEACAKCELLPDALIAIDRALDQARTTGFCWYEAEIYRLRARLTMQASGSTEGAQPSEVKNDLRSAIAIARKQDARFIERRAVLDFQNF